MDLGPAINALLYNMTCSVWYPAYTSPDGTPEETIIEQDAFGNVVNVTSGGVGQNEWGEAIKVWGEDRVENNAYFNVMGTVNLQDLSADREFEYKKRLNGRFKFDSDPRKGSDGVYHPVSDILITNIMSGGKQLHTNHRGVPIIFEVMSVDPFIDPFGKIEYYKLLLERADDQELIIP
jgi:hypothetical protein